MADIELLIPAPGFVPVEDLLKSLKETGGPAFSDDMVNFCANLSRLIFRDREASRFPELTALAFWMRKAEILRMREEFVKLERPDTLLVPRGLVLHFPPGNVDTIFIYSWLMAALTGNRNLIRLSSRSTPQSEILVRLLREALDKASGAVRNSTAIVTYGHDVELSAALSAACDVRVIWGGDETVSSIRKIPIAPHARELTFPDRSSLSIIHTASYLDLDEAARDQLADQFFNDAYWFDQMACSSPRLVVWCGLAEQATRASNLFWPALAQSALRRQYQAAPAVHMKKLLFACHAILTTPISAYHRYGDVTALDLGALEAYSQEHCGGGLFISASIEHLADLRRVVKRKDQTMTHFGFSADELRHLAVILSGRGIDRMVPIGQALLFNRFWDGHDLLREFCRLVYIGMPTNTTAL